MNTDNRKTVRDIMQQNVLTVGDNWSLDQLARFLTDNQISGAPVVSDDGNPVGVVSLTDLVRHSSASEGQEVDIGTHEYYLHSLELQVSGLEATSFQFDEASTDECVRDIMTPMVFKVTDTASIQDAADIMVKGHIHRLFVTSDNRISGVISALDMLAVLRDMQ